MTAKTHDKHVHTDNDTIETVIHCLNTKRKFIYILKNGQIISERIEPVLD